jgi:hypothetical protein
MRLFSNGLWSFDGSYEGDVEVKPSSGTTPKGAIEKNINPLE